MSAHTERPWEVHEGDDYIHIYGGEYDDSSKPLAEVTRKEDARLIAMAPDLLAMLKAANRACFVTNSSKDMREALKGSRDLIRRAEGRDE